MTSVHHLKTGQDSCSLVIDRANQNIESMQKTGESEQNSNKDKLCWWIVRKSDESNDAHSSKNEVEPVSPAKSNLAQIGVLYSPNRMQYIKKKAQTKMTIDQLNYSARFTFVNMEIKLHTEGSIMTTANNFVAVVKLEHPEQLDACNDFEQAKKVLIEQLRITKIYRDGLREQRDDIRKKLIPAIENVIQKSAFNEKHANNYIQLVKITNMLKNSDRMNYRYLCKEISNNTIVSEELKWFAKKLFQLEGAIIKRDKWFESFEIQTEDKKSDLTNELEKLLEQTFAFFKSSLLENTPVYLRAFSISTCENRLKLVSSEDIKVFKDISTILNKTIFQKPLDDLIARWCDLVRAINTDETRKVVRFTKPIFFFLCKSLEEVIVEISNKTGIKVNKLLISDKNEWYPIKSINWEIEHPLNRCLENEYYFIFKLLKHFDLTQRNTRPFNYNVALLARSKASTYRYIMESANKWITLNKPKNNLGVSDDIYIWYCMLDDVLSNVLPVAAIKHGGEFDQFGHILQNYTKLVREAGHDQLETVRVISHSLGRFIVQAIQLLKQDHNSAADRRVLHGQLDVIGRVGFESSNYFRDLIDVFSGYWRCRNEIIARLSMKMALPEMQVMCAKLLEIVLVALKKRVGAGEMVTFCRAYNDFIIDLGEVQFDWFVKHVIDENNCIDPSILQMVENKWSDTENATYRVVNLDDFLDFLNPPPKHYTIVLINTLLSNILSQLGKREWSPNNLISAKDQVATASCLISAIRSSLIYLSEQPEYVSFDRFYEERVNPFASVIENSTNQSDFYSRVSLIKDSFWYIRKQNEMSIDYALKLFEKLNENFEGELLRQAYNSYCEHFDKTMETSIGKEYVETVEFVAQQVKKTSREIHFSLWNSQFKQNSVPTMLAKVAALWTVQVSKDVSSTVGYFKPHCIQVLCVLRMLSVDTIDEGVGKHFAQVLTGQGKSLVLALTAAILALTGHTVDIVCYNKYLVERDEQDFLEFFSVLKVNDKIKYNTFDTIANKIITLESNSICVGLREVVKNLVLNEAQPSFTVPDNNREKSILLIDEADVFFTKKFYGKTYCPASCPMIPGLSSIQENIWKIINENLDTDALTMCKDRVLNSDAYKILEKHNSFISEIPYKLLIKINDSFVQTTITTKNLFNEHLLKMINCAWKIQKNILQEKFISRLKLSEQNSIHCMDDNGMFSNNYFVDYYTMFAYFKLKQTDFVPTIGAEKNYGYFVIECGAISYALLPLDYPLILGVTGTLGDLNFHEKDAIQNIYEIKQLSFMPSFFGSSNLRFDEEEDFDCLFFAEQWMSQIFQHTYTEIAQNRAVIIFFETDAKLEEFYKEYSSKFDRINVFTINTIGTERVRIINEAGVAKTVTLANRQMGRGVDFKSSVAVEKNGGVHVIQTFFSVDVKEEIQIKGRTARKDNKGSYELIICEQDLPHQEETGIGLKLTYENLDKDRKIKSLEVNKELASNIKQAQHDHEVTMEYLKSFCERKN